MTNDVLTIKRREVMRATMAPDVYSGPDCDHHAPRWVGSAEGDIDGDGDVGVEGVLMLAAHTFPPGTTVVVSEPECPQCGCVPYLISEFPAEQMWGCECDFDWRYFTEELFS